jgi:hypothetical protein
MQQLIFSSRLKNRSFPLCFKFPELKFAIHLSDIKPEGNRFDLSSLIRISLAGKSSPAMKGIQRKGSDKGRHVCKAAISGGALRGKRNIVGCRVEDQPIIALAGGELNAGKSAFCR